MLIFESSSFMVTTESLFAGLHLQCIKRLVLNEFKEGLVKALSFAEKNEIKSWLLDLKEIGCLNEEEESWLQLHLFPMLMSSMGPNNHIAIVLSEKCYNALLLQAGKYGLKSYNSFIIINTFCKSEEAIEWLERESSLSVGS